MSNNYQYGFRRTAPSVYQENLRKTVSPDKYATFKWRTPNANSYELFGAFILNGGDDLKWVNAAEFEDQYSESLYQDHRTLLGVTSKSKKISFDIGVYAITLTQYKELVAWLDPYIISQLIFDYDSNWYYDVKISEITESKKYVIDYDGEEPLYYAELTITFETQNEGYTTCLNSWEQTSVLPFTSDDTTNNTDTSNLVLNNFYSFIGTPSELDHPCSITINLTTDSNPSIKHEITCKAYLLKSTVVNGEIVYQVVRKSETNLFNVEFSNENQNISFTYNSERGLLLYGNQLLTLQTVNEKGSSIVSGYNCYQFVFPGLMNSPYMDQSIIYNKQTYLPVAIEIVPIGVTINNVAISTYPRNVLS